MKTRWLLDRMLELNQPAPHFAFYGTVNWMRALSLLVKDGAFTHGGAKEFYSEVVRRQTDRATDTAVFDSIFLSFNHLAGLMAITDIEDGYDVCRPAISAWYHCVYSAAGAMVTAAGGQQSENAVAMSDVWQRYVVAPGFVMSPFSPSLDSLVKADSERGIRAFRGDNRHDLSESPSNANEAWGGAVSYLHGTADFERERAEDALRRDPDFVSLGVTNFRTKRAREYRDSYLSSMQVNFLTEAARYVGKANFRDSIFLTYGEGHRTEIDQLLVDLGYVGSAFLLMACAFCSRQTERGAWGEFVEDLESNSLVSLDVEALRALD